MLSDPILSCINSGQIYQLARRMFPGVRAMALLPEDGGLLLEGEAEDAAELEQELRALWQQQSEQQREQGSWTQLSPGGLVFMRNLRTYTESLVACFVLLFDSAERQDEDAIQTLCDVLLNDYQLNAELDSATMELTDRYEELNLIYGTDDTADRFDRGQSVLTNLVLQCAERMNVNTTVLYLPDQEILIIEQDEAANMASLPVEDLAESVFMPWVLARAETIVINDEYDPHLQMVCDDLGHKLLISPVYGFGSHICGYLGVFNTLDCKDFSNSDRNLLQILTRKASRVVQGNYDELTGLANRYSFDFKLDELIEQQTEQDDASLLLIGLRGLHVINDSAGTEAGDALIRSVAELLPAELDRMAISPAESFLARYEGDIFSVLLHDTELELAREIAADLLTAINAMPFRWDQDQFHIHASIGLVPVDSSQDAEFSLSNARIALDLAAEKGNDVIEMQRADDSAIANRKARMRTLNLVHEALEADLFQLYCQGVYAIENTNTPHHYEILLRMVDRQGQIVSPTAFIPAAEYYKIMPDVDRWVIRNTLQLLSNSWQELDSSSQSWAINLSGQTFSQAGLVEFIREQIDESDVPAQRIAFEVTETVAVEDLDKARSILEEIQALGCEFYLDDFGTGLSSFTYLQGLPFNHVKIDGSFVKNVVEDTVAQAMVRAIADVAKVLGMQTVAEYVEDDQTIKVLARLGVDYLQGYCLHKPSPLHQVIASRSQRKSA